MTKLAAPIGYKLTQEVDPENENDVRELCNSLTQNLFKDSTMEEMLAFLKKSGFEIYEDDSKN